MLSGVGVPELWECSVELWPRDFGVSVWGFRGCSMGSVPGALGVFRIGSCVFGDA